MPVLVAGLVALLAAAESATAAPPGRTAGIEQCELEAEDEWVCAEHPPEASELECEIDWATNKPAWRCR